MADWKKVVIESSTGNIAQNAATATALETARDFSITGEVTASAVSFDGTGNVALSATVANNIIDEPNLKATNSPTDDYILSYDAATQGFTWIANTASANDNTVTLSAGAGLQTGGSFTVNQGSDSTITFNIDLQDVQEAVFAPADDYVNFLDGGSTGATRKEQWADIASAVAGTNLTSQAGVIGLATNVDVAGTLDVTSTATFDNNVTIAGDLTVNGTTTTVNSTTVEVADKLLKLANVTTPTTTTANGGGIQLESSATEAEWPEFKWSSSANLTGWQLSDHNATSSTMFEVAVMEFGTADPSSPDIQTQAGAGAFFADTTGGNLWLYI